MFFAFCDCAVWGAECDVTPRWWHDLMNISSLDAPYGGSLGGLHEVDFGELLGLVYVEKKMKTVKIGRVK